MTKNAGQTLKTANKRGVARLAAVQALYQMDIAGTPVDQIVAEFENFRIGHEIDGERYLSADPDFFRSILNGVVNAQREIDPQIHLALSDDWPLSRIDSIMRAMLRSGCFELRGRADVPAKVIINEYVDVAKAFFDDDVPAMVNGVLARLAVELRPAEMEGDR